MITQLIRSRQLAVTRFSFGRTIAAMVCIAALAACSDNAAVLGPHPTNSLFASYVAMGNSITSGYQSGGINDSTQRESYAALLAAQMGTRYAYPSLVDPGCPPPIVDFHTQARAGNGTSTTCLGRNPSSVTAALNNVAVPGATSLDPTSSSTSASNALTTFILGGKTQVERARDAAPTFISAWIGNNDVLPAAVSGILVPSAGISPGVTSQTQFQTNYDSMVTELKQIPTLKGAVLIGVVQVTDAPVFFPATALFNTQFKAGFDAAAGTTTVILPTCALNTKSLISFQLAAAIHAGQHPAAIGCTKNSVPSTAVGDVFVLDSAEQVQVQAAVTAYNTYIQSVAATNGWAYFDPNPILDSLRTAGAIPTVPNIASATQPFGAYITLDGIHPSAAAHKLVADHLIDVINAKYGTSLAAVQ